MPHPKALVERHKDDPFVLLGVNTGDEPKEFREGLATYGVTWRAAYQGPEGLIAKLYQVNAYPTYFLIGPDGKILGTGHNGEAYDEKIAKLVAEIKKAQESK
ncbi:MAG: TlpA disulfide reductase family protein [Planctomycetota bacterium]